MSVAGPRTWSHPPLQEKADRHCSGHCQKGKGGSHQSQCCSLCTAPGQQNRMRLYRDCLDRSLNRNHGRIKGPGERKPKGTQNALRTYFFWVVDQVKGYLEDTCLIRFIRRAPPKQARYTNKKTTVTGQRKRCPCLIHC